MAKLTPFMRLKVKGDTFFLPDPNGAVYFRNNKGSFRMEGRTIHQWIEKLLPVFDGKHTLEDLTHGLPPLYRDRVYEIAEVLYQNGYVRDVSQDHSHPLADAILSKYAAQIEFLDHFGDSGGYRLHVYRQTKVLAVGSGPFLVSLVAALLESGIPKLHVLLTDSVPTHRERLTELVAHARKTDPEVELKDVCLRDGECPWHEAVQPFDVVMYVSQDVDVEEIRAVHTACREERKAFLPAVCMQQAGVAGPLVEPDSPGCWESARRRIHESVLDKDPQLHTFSTTAGAMLANVIVFDWFKVVTGVIEPELRNQFFLLNLETLEGSTHPFLRHPLVAGYTAAERVHDFNRRLAVRSERTTSNGLLPYFSLLTSVESGIFHIWEEGDLNQLPLAQCRVQVVDPLTEGPAALLPSVVCTGLTHEEARREAGLFGIEAYVSRMVDLFLQKPSVQSATESSAAVGPEELVGVGAGETVSEGVFRGLQSCLSEELRTWQNRDRPSIERAQLHAVEDERCQYYLQALTTLQGAPEIGLGQKIFGFPVAWVGTGQRWYGGVGLNVTLAFRNALQSALGTAQNHPVGGTLRVLEVSDVLLKDSPPQSLVIPSFVDVPDEETLQSAFHVLQQNHRRHLIFDLAVEPFLREGLAGVFGVVLREEESR